MARADWNFEGVFVDVDPTVDLAAMTEEIERLGNDPSLGTGGPVFVSDQAAATASRQRLDAAVGSLPRGGGDRVRHRRAADRGTGRRACHLGAARGGQHPPGARAAAHRSPRCPAGSAALVGCSGALGAVVVALALSSRFPIGVAREAEPDPGFAVDSTVLLVGGVAIIVVTVASAAISGLTAAPTPARCTDVPRGWRVPPPGWGWAPRLSRGCASRSAAEGVTRCRCEALSPRSPWRSPRSSPRSRSPTASSPCWIRPRGTGRGGTG